MYGITFGGIHSYRDLGLVMQSRPVISPPTVKKIYVDIEGGDGKIDLTEAVTGGVFYENRDIKMKLYCGIGRRNAWSNTYSRVLNLLHGRKMKIILDEDPGYYYEGRVEIDEWSSDASAGLISITADVNPYKTEVRSTTEPWLWDNFCFEGGVIQEYESLKINGTKKIKLESSGVRITDVTITAQSADGLTITYNGKTHDISEGENVITDISCPCDVTIQGSGQISIDYRGVSL